eukprot:CFRG7715T1
MQRTSTSVLRARAAVSQSGNLNGPFKRTIYSTLYNVAKKVVPAVSDTERAALECGTVGFDRDLFGGAPKLSSLNKYRVVLSDKEKAFLNTEVNELCEMLDDYQVGLDQDIPAEAWKFLREKKFMSMIIPEEQGGLGFSAHAHSFVDAKISTRCASASICVGVPNSLGPGELIMKYGTDAQKKHFLPRLGDGREVPCFGLTGPSSGSDAASMPDHGEVVMRDGKLGIVASFNKRYITLAPVATIVGVAFKLSDPNNLLKGVGKEGISLALIPKGHPGLETGERHDVLSIGFMNGPVRGKDVFFPIEFLIGGQEQAGYGWNMLMECLSEGRGITLPASSVAVGQMSAVLMGSYARIRKQFKVPIAELEGVQEKLCDIAREAYTMTASQHLMNAMLLNHEKPSVLSAVMKMQLTDRARKVINDSMDVAGGSGICKGKNNLLGNPYQGIPIAITVEGSNVLTRSLIIFGQGLIRSHPHVLDLMHSVHDGNDLKGFKKHLGLLIGHAVSNTTRSLKSAVLRSRFRSNKISYYESQMARLSTNFAITSDMAMSIGGQLKFAEFTSGRFADVLSNLYMGYANLWYYKNHYVQGHDELLTVAMEQIIYDTQNSLIEISANFPIRPVGWAMKAVTFPFGKCYRAPTDTMRRNAAQMITTETEVREQFKENIFISTDPEDRANMIDTALPIVIRADAILKQLRKEMRDASEFEMKIINHAEALRDQIIQVDSHPALGRKYWENELLNKKESQNTESKTPKSKEPLEALN